MRLSSVSEAIGILRRVPLLSLKGLWDSVVKSCVAPGLRWKVPAGLQRLCPPQLCFQAAPSARVATRDIPFGRPVSVSLERTVGAGGRSWAPLAGRCSGGSHMPVRRLSERAASRLGPRRASAPFLSFDACATLNLGEGAAFCDRVLDGPLSPLKGFSNSSKPLKNMGMCFLASNGVIMD